MRILAYRDFWDFPRIFVVRLNDRLLLFDCPFNDPQEDFSNDFLVYELPSTFAKRLPPPRSWLGLAGHGTFVGRVPTNALSFDKTRRRSIDDAFLKALKPEK